MDEYGQGEKNHDQRIESQGNPYGTQGPGPDNGDSPYPEPPEGWKPQYEERNPRPDANGGGDSFRQVMKPVGNNVITLGPEDSLEFSRARKFITASQVVALVSLFIGGVLLSAVAIVLAVIGFRKLTAIAEKCIEEFEVRRAFKRPGLVAIALSVGALVINAISIIVFYPLLLQALQQGDFASVFTGAGVSSGGSAPANGSSLFG